MDLQKVEPPAPGLLHRFIIYYWLFITAFFTLPHFVIARYEAISTFNRLPVCTAGQASRRVPRGRNDGDVHGVILLLERTTTRLND
jgi:hypothetical protein